MRFKDFVKKRLHQEQPNLTDEQIVSIVNEVSIIRWIDLYFKEHPYSVGSEFSE